MGMARVWVGDVSLNYEQEGFGTDLVLIHGLGSDLTIWDAEAAAFAAHHRVTRPDVRGFGGSDTPPGPYSPAMLARDLDGLFRVCDVAAAHVVGISMGGVIAQRVALDFPQRVRSLVLVSTSSEVGQKSIAAWQRLAERIERDGFDAQTADASRAFSRSFAQRHPELVGALGRRTAACDPHGYAAAARAVSDYNWTAELARVTAPTLILQGLDDQLTPPGGSVKMSRGLPHARLLMIPGAGHNLPIELPELFRNSVLAFIAGVDFARCDVTAVA
jgi:pimeloyl-ACP methyl ester carboxylesterase